jgi:peptide/nickel transport system permease protein
MTPVSHAASPGPAPEGIERPAVTASRLPLISLTILGVVLLAGILAPVLAPHAPGAGDVGNRFLPPALSPGGTPAFLLGTDHLGRDILSRILYGARYSLIVGAVAILLGASVGTVVGMLAGYAGGLLEGVLMRLVDLMLSLPVVLVALLLATLTRPSFGNVILVLVLFLWAQYARQVRAETLALRERDFVRIARVYGVSPLGVVFRHVLPNVRDTVIVLATVQLAVVILLESSLSFLGVGIPPPTPAWGLMVADGAGFMRVAWWASFFPGLAIALTVIAVNLTGDWLRDRLDPRRRLR